MSTPPQTNPELLRTIPIEIEHSTITRFRQEAARRDVPVVRLVHDLLNVVAADGLVTAVLDDDPPPLSASRHGPGRPCSTGAT